MKAQSSILKPNYDLVGLKKASKTHAAQAKTLQGVLRKNATRNSNN